MPQRLKSTWVFNCANTFTGNPKWLFIYVNEFRPDIDAYWISDSEATTKFVQSLGYKAVTFKSAEGVKVQQRSGVFVVNQAKEHIGQHLKGITLLNLWHGVGVKKVERAMRTGDLIPRLAEKYIRNNKTYRDTQMFLVTSPLMEKHFGVQIGFDEEQIIRGGYPQNIYTSLHGEVTTFDHNLRARNGAPADAKIVVYSPTYRPKHSSGFLSEALPDVSKLIETLEAQNILLVLKMHPRMQNDVAFTQMREMYGSHPRLHFWDNDEDVYEIFHQVDLAIVDYSSILYDMMAAGVTHFIRYAFDLDKGDGVLEPGLDYKSMSCGELVSSFDSLLEALKKPCEVDDATLERIKTAFWEYSTDTSLEHIVDRALEFTPRDLALPTLYSFDVFDTVIHRKTILPNGVFYFVRQKMQGSTQEFPPFLTERFPEARMQAESSARQNKRKRPELVESGKLEITLDEIYIRLQTLFSLTNEQANTLKAWEVEGELLDCTPDPVQVDRVKALVSKGETVVFVSDMYLPFDIVRALLQKAEPTFEKISLYLSNDFDAQKTTGRLFLKVFEDLDYNFAQWRHVGDSYKADIQVPKSLGITPEKLETPNLSDYEQKLVEEIPTHDGYLLAGMLHSYLNSAERSSTERFVYRHVSMYLVPYIDWAIADAVRRGYTVLYFISRDGHYLKRIADALIKERGIALKTKYIYGSRRAWRLASQADGVHDDTFSPYGDFGGVRSFNALLDASRMTAEEFTEMFPTLSVYAGKDHLNGYTVGGIVAMLKASMPFRSHLEKIAREDHRLAIEYLRQEVDFNDKFAFVEYWGRGYTQSCLAALAEAATGETIDIPFYYARSIYPTEGTAIRHNFTAASYSLIFIESIFANLPYGTTEGYRESETGIAPVTSPRSYDENLYMVLESELEQFAKDYARLDLIDPLRLRRDAFRFGFEYFRAHPDDDIYVERVAHLKDSVELGSAEREFAPKFTLSDFLHYMRGKPLSEFTRSLPITYARSRGAGVLLLKLQKRVGFRRRIKAFKRSIGERRESKLK